MGASFSSCNPWVTPLLVQEGVRGLYKGVLLSMVGIVPYLSVSLATYDTLKHQLPSDKVRALAAHTARAPLAAAYPSSNNNSNAHGQAKACLPASWHSRLRARSNNAACMCVRAGVPVAVVVPPGQDRCRGGQLRGSPAGVVPHRHHAPPHAAQRGQGKCWRILGCHAVHGVFVSSAYNPPPETHSVLATGTTFTVLPSHSPQPPTT